MAKQSNGFGLPDVFQNFINACAEAIVVADENEKIVICSNGAETMFGYKPQEMVGKKFGNVIVPEEFDYIREGAFKKADQNRELPQKGAIIKATGLKKDGSEFPMEHTLSMLRTGESVYLVAILRDVTRKDLVEQQLRLMASVFMENADPILIEDLSGNVIDMNNAAELAYGWRRDELVGNPIKAIVPPDRHDQADALLAQCKEHASVRNVEGLRITKDGETLPVLLSLSLLTDEADKPVGVATISKSLVEQKEAEHLLSQTIREWHQFIDTANAPIFGVDTKGRINEWNQMAARITGYEKDEVAGRGLVEHYITDEYKASVKEVLDNALAGKETDNYQVPLFTKKGERVMVLLNASTRRDVEGNTIGVVGVGQDITELISYREDLEGLINNRTEELATSLLDTEKARDRIDGILQSVADGLIVTDAYNRVILMNRVAEDLLGLRFSEVIDRPIDCAIDEPTLRDKVTETLSKKKATGYQFDFDVPSNDAERPRILRARTSLIHDRDGKESGIVTIIHDVTHEREVDRMKTEFISTAAHELRTPLTSIQGFSEILLTREALSPDEKRKYLTYINKQSVELASITTDLLDITRIESGHGYSLQRNMCNAGDAINQTLPFFRDSYKKHHFEVILPSEADELFCDKERIGQALKNLLSNAAKYSPEGGLVRVTAEAFNDYYQISVQDQGLGMSQDQIDKVFDKFYRVDASNVAIGGAGLGMTIVKDIVEAHGGKVWVESTLGKGTTVSFTVPYGKDIKK